jgi:23S rRNA (uracil1939-C5)-methyltransferase
VPAELDLEPTAMVAGGAALARDSAGRVVFVQGALPGERVRVRLTAERRDVAHGVAVDIIDASAERIAAPCVHVGRGCGGCGWQHITIDGQRGFKEAIVRDALRRIARLPDAPLRPTLALPATGFRTTVRAAVDKRGHLGLRRYASHEVIDVDSCLVAHPLIEDLVAVARFPGASEVVLRCSASTGERVAAPRPVSSAHQASVPGDVLVAGRDRSPAIREDVAGRRWRVSASSFFQSRPDGAAALSALVTDALPGGDPSHAADLYAGVGLFAGALATAGLHVVAVERARAAVADARHNLAGLDVRVIHADVAAWRPRRVDVAVADPSRDGLGKAAADVVAATHASRVVLVSCDAASLARDVALLRDRGYALLAVTPVDLFPHTPHVETVSVLDRVSPG